MTEIPSQRNLFFGIFVVFLVWGSSQASLLMPATTDPGTGEDRTLLAKIDPEPAFIGPERKLYNIASVKNTILRELPNNYVINNNQPNDVTVRHKTKGYITFSILFKSLQRPENSNVDLYAITFTNSPKMTVQKVGFFNAFYRIIIPADASPDALRDKARRIFEVEAKGDSEHKFLTELEQYAPMSMPEIFQTATVQELIKEILITPDTATTNTGLFSQSKCKGHADLNCRIQIYPIDEKWCGMVVWLAGHEISLSFPKYNFEENFKLLKPIFTKKLEDALKKEEEEKKTTQPFESFISTVGESLNEVCKECYTKKTLTESEAKTQTFVNEFSTEKKVLVKVAQGQPAKTQTEMVKTILFLTYNSWERFQFCYVVLDNPRVRKDLILPLYQTELKKRLVEEGKSFVTLTEGDFEHEDDEIFLKTDDVKKVFEEIKESCDGGAVVDVPGNGFDFNCGDLKVVSVRDINNDQEASIRITFTVLKGKDEAAAMGTGFILSKMSMFNALEKIKPDLTAYLEAFKAAG